MNTTYAAIRHTNSNTSRRRGLTRIGKGDHITHQIVKHPEGQPLPHVHNEHRTSRYMPHVGKKQLAKMTTRNHVSA